MTVRRGATLVLALLFLGAGGTASRPKATVTRTGALTITLPATVLESRQAAEQLSSGLTTVYILRAEAKDESGTTKGGARIEVRLDLWEEKYFVTVTEPTGVMRKLTFAAEEGLARWWGENQILVIPARKFGSRVDVAMTLTMLPFSSQEQRETEQWLARTLSAGRSQGGEALPAQSAEILRVIVETSSRRRPLLAYRWSTRAVRETP